MSELKHTPGPWRVEMGQTDIASKEAKERLWGFPFINILASLNDTDSLPITQVRPAVCMDWETVLANARLMAAAPEMFEALLAQEAVDEHCANCEDCEGGAFPELCEVGFPIADHARLLRRAVLAKLA